MALPTQANVWIVMNQIHMQRLLFTQKDLHRPTTCYRLRNRRIPMYKNLLRYAKPIKVNSSELMLAENQAVRRLKPAQRDLVLRAIRRHNTRWSYKCFFGTRKPSLYERLQKHLRKTIFTHVRSAFMDHYRMAMGRWAGGENYINVIRDPKPYADGYSVKEWSSNGRWSGCDAYFTINVAPDWQKSVFDIPGLTTAGGMLTTHAIFVQENLWQASWVKQSIGFKIKTESGFIAQLPEGEWLHGKTLNAIEKQLKAKLAAKAKELSHRQITKLSAQDLSKLYGDVVITVQDSINAGNCRTGTEHWCNLHMDGRTSARISEIILNPGFNLHTRKAIIQRIIRHV